MLAPSQGFIINGARPQARGAGGASKGRPQCARCFGISVRPAHPGSGTATSVERCWDSVSELYIVLMEWQGGFLDVTLRVLK